MLGKDVSALHKFVDPSGLPEDFGGKRSIDLSKFLDDLENEEKRTGNIGGFAVPFSVEDPTGEKRGIHPVNASLETSSSTFSPPLTTTTEW